MQRRQFLIGLIGTAITATGTFTAVEAATPAPELDRVMTGLEAVGPEAEYSFLIGRMTHRRRAGGWWRQRTAAARRWGRRRYR